VRVPSAGLRRFDRKWLGGRLQGGIDVIVFASPLLAAAILLSVLPLDVEPAAATMVWVAGGVGSVALVAWRSWRYIRQHGTTAASERAMRRVRYRSERVNG
jgi:hypothetical protein